MGKSFAKTLDRTGKGTREESNERRRQITFHSFRRFVKTTLSSAGCLIFMTGECSSNLRYRSILSMIAVGSTIIASVFILSTLIHIPQIYAVTSPGSSQSVSELSISDIIGHRLLLLGGIYEAINQLPDSAFTNIQQRNRFKARLLNDTNPDSGNISTLLRSDELDAVIARLYGLKTEVTRIAIPHGNNLVFLIDNLIGTLEKQQ